MASTRIGTSALERRRDDHSPIIARRAASGKCEVPNFTLTIGRSTQRANSSAKVSLGHAVRGGQFIEDDAPEIEAGQPGEIDDDSHLMDRPQAAGRDQDDRQIELTGQIDRVAVLRERRSQPARAFDDLPARGGANFVDEVGDIGHAQRFARTPGRLRRRKRLGEVPASDPCEVGLPGRLG